MGAMKDRAGPLGLTIVIKVGTSSLVRPEQNTLNLSNLARLCEVVRELNAQNHRVVIVSSGAVGVGAQRLGLSSRPSKLPQKQALAAVGQVHLMRFYDDFFSALGLTCAQVLLSLGNLANRMQYLNASNTFTELFSYGTVPIVNENDTVAVEELRIGDNDTLSAQVATMVRADWLFLLTDVPCLYTANPSVDPSAEPIHEVRDIAALQVDTSAPGTQWGTGGMATKLTAARLATAAGCHMAICEAMQPESISAVLRGEKVGTVFYPQLQSLKGRKRWILSVPVRGAVRMDAGAVRAVEARGKSLFSAGLLGVAGDFSAQDAVQLCDAAGREFGRGLCNYSAAEVERIKGLSSKDFVTELGYLGCEEIFHRDNICLLQRPHSSLSEANLVAAGEQQADTAVVNGLSSSDDRGHSSPDNGSDRDKGQGDAEPAKELQQECPQLAAAQPDSRHRDAEAAYSAHQDRPQSEGGKPKQHPSLASRDEDCFQEAGVDEVGFKFRGVSIPGGSRQTSDDLGSRLAVLRDRDQSHSQKADSLARHSWAGEYSSSGPARVHVLHCIEEQKWHEGKPATLWLSTTCLNLDASLKAGSDDGRRMRTRTNSDVMERLKQIRDGGPDRTGSAGKEYRDREPDKAGPSDKEHQEWMAKLAHASAVERAAEAGEPPEAGSGHVRSPPCSPAQLGQGRAPWKASSQQAIPLKGRRQHGSSNALSLMHMSPSPAAYDVNQEGWLPR